MIEFLITILLLLVVIYVVKLVIDSIPLPENIKIVAYIILGLVVLLWLLQRFGIYTMAL
jgi:hypothetical protein